MGVEINSELGNPKVEIDESKIISKGHEIYLMLGVINKNTKKALIRYVLNVRTKQKISISLISIKLMILNIIDLY